METDSLLLKLGNRIRELRLQKGLSQGGLATAIGKDQQSIQRLEVGGVNPSFKYLLEIAGGLDVSLAEIFRDW